MPSWESPPLHRHLSTIGIGPVFVCPPSHPLPPHPVEIEVEAKAEDEDDTPVQKECNGAPSSSSQHTQSTIETWEIIGDIKSSPEDFIVREIGWAPPSSCAGVGEANECDGKYETSKYRRKAGWSRRIAGVECDFKSTDPSPAEQTASIKKNMDKDIISQVQSCVTVGTKSKSNNGNEGGPSNEGGNNTAKEDGSMPAPKRARATDTNSGDDLTEGGMEAEVPPKLSTTSQADVSPSTSKGQTDKGLEPEDTNPKDGLRRVLIRCHTKNNQKAIDITGESGTSPKEGETAADATLNQLADLQNLALEKIGKQNSTSDDASDGVKSNTVWIPTSELFQNSSALNVNSTEDWKFLHRYIRQVFPLLQTESSSVGPNAVDSNQKNGEEKVKDNDNDSSAKNAWVCALIDYTFSSLAPLLSNPREDLHLLYKFRNHGPMPALSTGGERNRSSSMRQNKWKKNKQNNGKGQELPKEEQPGIKGDGTPKTSYTSSQGQILLRLRPDLPRSERRGIHQILSPGRKREFETSTEHDVPLDYADKNAQKTTAILVQWSRNAIQASQKRKRAAEDGNGNSSSNGNSNKKPQSDRTSNITAIFCILRKHQVEHQAAIQNVSRALRCRSGDIGLGGIKDMQAVTYQYCTLRNVDLKKAQRANDFLGNKIQLSHFTDGVQNFLLDRGKLLGNCFEITIRNLKRVERLYVEGEETQTSSWKERAVPVHSSHLDAMVKRMGKGFINFYGEQRVGAAGSRSHAGVRSFDVGCAMLQRDFAKAIDLIMTGRSKEVYTPGAEEIEARSVWKKSGGDARAVLKAFPKNRNAMVRERDLMKGLLRYGDALQAIRCIPHSMRMFWIHGYQSYVWNRVATERVKRWGIRPVVGDLYIRELECGTDDKCDTANVQVVSDPSSVDICQVVLPLPGYNIQYPSNEVGELYSRILKDDGVDLSVKDNIPEATAKGSYRKLIQSAGQLKWDMIPDDGEERSGSSEDPVVSAARFTFELESGCYATVMLRELMVATMARDSKQ